MFRYFEALPSLGRRLRVATPCMGIDGAGHALKLLKCPADIINCYDLEDSYRSCLTKHLHSMGMQVVELHVGKIDGNLLSVPLTSLSRPVDFLISGPPCPPWAGQGKHKGRADPKADVFMAVVSWVIFLVGSGGLLGVVLENVPGIMSETSDGHESVGAVFLKVLRKYCPEFDWVVDKLELVNYLHPQTRVRVFIRGLRKVICQCVPPPLQSFGRRSLKEALGLSPYTPRNVLSVPQQQNLKDAEAEAKKLHAAGKVNLCDLIVVPVDRSWDEDIQYNASLSVNQCPTLTTHNVYLFVLEVGDVINNIEDSQRTYFRKITDPERLALQGFPPNLALDLPPNRIVFAAGNAFPPPLIAALLHPMLKAMGASTFSLASWPPSEILSDAEPPHLAKAMKELRSPGKIVNREKFEAAKMLKMRGNNSKKRRRNDEGE